METVVSKNERSSSRFFSGVFILSVSTVIVKVIGLFYKIPMLSILGAEGMGYFNSAYEIYALLCVISTAGLPVALSMLVSSYKEAGNIQKINEVYRSALFLFLVVGVLGSGAMLVFADKLSVFIKNEGALYSIMAISPALLCVCVSSAVRGYFQGYLRMMPTALSQLIEAVSKLLFGMLFALYALRSGYSISMVAAFAILGLSLGTLISAVYLVILKLKSNRHLNIKKDVCRVKTSSSAGQLFKIALPITISSAVISVTRIVDMALIMRRLQDIGYSAGVANEIYGVYTTVAVPIFSLVPSLLAPISMSLVPALSAAIERGDGHSDVVGGAIKLTVFFALPSSLALALYSYPIISLLFFNVSEDIGYVAPLLSLLGLSVLFSCLITTTNAILQSYRRVNLPIISMALGAVVKIISAYILIGIPSVNVFGAPISTFLCDLTITIINLIIIYRLGERSVAAISVFGKPLVSSVVAMVISFGVYMFIYSKTEKIRLSFIVIVPITVVLYLLMSFATKSITYEDILELPMGDKICKLFKGRLKNKV